MDLPLLTRIRKMEPSLATLFIILVGAVAVIGLAAAISAPSAVLVGESQWELISAFHGMGATVFLLAATISVYLAWRLYTGQLTAFKDFRLLTTFSAFMSVVTVAFGNWIYIGYRGAGGPRSYFLGTLPEVHEIFFEFKEFIALFTLPMLITSSFILWRYGPGLKGHRDLRAVASVPVLLGWLFLVVAYLLGAAITKLRPVGVA